MSLSNNKFQTENIELKNTLAKIEKDSEEYQVKITLLRKALGDIQDELKTMKKLEEQIDTMIFERSELKLQLEEANDKVISLNAIIEAKNKELSIPREVIIQAPPPDIYEPKYNDLHEKFIELLSLYNERSKRIDSLEKDSDDKDKIILDLQNSLENINLSVEKFKNENYRLRKSLPIIEEPPVFIQHTPPHHGGSRRSRLGKI
jgi:DNA repair exonuclease SbcCD ATPase subunit